VILDIMSKDVIHGFNVPALRIKQDAIPGQSVSIWFTAVKPGIFEIACAQLCGLGHYRMRGVVTVESPEEFDAWVRENSPAAPEPK
jgi:cytochrome c oxidase subunit 2